MDTSTTSRLSAAWVGTAKYNTTPAVSVLKVAMSTGFAVNDTYLTSTVTLQNLLSTPLYNVSWMRSIDPDNDAVRSPSRASFKLPCSVVHIPCAHPSLLSCSVLTHSQSWNNSFATKNYVQYQRYRVGEPDHSNPAVPNMCMVVATGSLYPNIVLGMATVHPNCRVSHFGALNIDANAAWTNTIWTAYNATSPRYADEGMNLVYRFAQLDAGATVKFTWAYIMSVSDLVTAMGVVAAVTIVQPSTTVSGTSATFSAIVTGTVSNVTFVLLSNTSVSSSDAQGSSCVPDGCSCHWQL